jgi:hypothetical protein
LLTQIRLKNEMFVDAVRMFATSVRELEETDPIEPTEISCKKPSEWEQGSRLLNFMRLVSYIVHDVIALLNVDVIRYFFNPIPILR